MAFEEQNAANQVFHGSRAKLQSFLVLRPELEDFLHAASDVMKATQAWVLAHPNHHAMVSKLEDVVQLVVDTCELKQTLLLDGKHVALLVGLQDNIRVCVR
jgi:L-arabinose isomerase